VEKNEALELLRDTHTFPGEFTFRVVARPPHVSAVVSSISAAAGSPGAMLGVEERRSRNGNYIAVHARVTVTSAEHVLEIYDVIRAVEGVVATM
jgi:putative lipoic acid-binding regulatory protein